MNNTENNHPTRLTDEAHNGQTAANTNKHEEFDKDIARLELEEILAECPERYCRIFFEFLLIAVVMASLFILGIVIWETGIDHAVNARLKSLTNSGVIQRVKPK